MRNLLATLFLSQGVPMLLAGDEIGRTQQGNNNAYCQDNELTWIDWRCSSATPGCSRFVAPADRPAPLAALAAARHVPQGHAGRGATPRTSPGCTRPAAR
ncbi:MAG: hypothetical protein MZV65_25820 [Chromatiales bacterium]|nr:hypothetical protein [Chromatiales bacterium]